MDSSFVEAEAVFIKRVSSTEIEEKSRDANLGIESCVIRLNYDPRADDERDSAFLGGGRPFCLAGAEPQGERYP